MAEDYKIKLRKKCKWCWLLLLLLLPLLLLIPLKKNVKIKVVNANDNTVISNIPVSFEYSKRDLFNFDSLKFFTNYTVPKPVLTDTTNSEGIVIFKDVKYSVYQWIFRNKDFGHAFFNQECFGADSTYKFFKLKNNKEVILYAAPKLIDLTFTVVDADDNNEPLPEASVTIKADLYNYIDSAKSNNAGEVTFKNVPACANIEVVGKKYGWLDDTIKSPARRSRDTLFLKQEKVIIKFFVKDLYSKQPLVNADGHLFLKEVSGEIGNEATSNINGVIKGVFDETHKVKSMKINVNTNPNLKFYNDTSTFDYLNYIRVDSWKKRTDEEKTIYIRPQPQPVTLKDVDCKTNVGISNVKNFVTITKSSDGSVVKMPTPVISNSNGEFTVSALPGDKITIEAEAQTNCPEYLPNNTTIVNVSFQDLLDDAGKRIIPLCTKEPVKLKFRTVEQGTNKGIKGVKNTGILDGNSTVIISENDGWFEVEAYECQTISIIADGRNIGYDKNDTKVKNRTVADLISAPLLERDIPLSEPQTPCNTPISASQGMSGEMYFQLGSKSYNFTLSYSVNSWEDRIVIYCGKGTSGKVLFDETVQYDIGSPRTIHYDANSCDGFITVTVIPDGGDESSVWAFEISCPD